jgi:hypothetical protein
MGVLLVKCPKTGRCFRLGFRPTRRQPRIFRKFSLDQDVRFVGPTISGGRATLCLLRPSRHSPGSKINVRQTIFLECHRSDWRGLLGRFGRYCCDGCTDAGPVHCRQCPAARAEAKAVIERWNEQLATSRDMLWSPTIRAALIAGTPWLEVFCPGCGTSRAINLRKVDRHPLASVATLVLGLRCSWCPESAPMPRILGLHALPPAAKAAASNL